MQIKGQAEVGKDHLPGDALAVELVQALDRIVLPLGAVFLDDGFRPTIAMRAAGGGQP
jgi:hypothetical protein